MPAAVRPSCTTIAAAVPATVSNPNRVPQATEFATISATFGPGISIRMLVARMKAIRRFRFGHGGLPGRMGAVEPMGQSFRCPGIIPHFDIGANGATVLIIHDPYRSRPEFAFPPTLPQRGSRALWTPTGCDRQAAVAHRRRAQ